MFYFICPTFCGSAIVVIAVCNVLFADGNRRKKHAAKPLIRGTVLRWGRGYVLPQIHLLPPLQI